MAEDPKSSDGRKHRTTSSTSGGPLAGHPDPPERTSEDRQDVTTVLQDKRQSHFDKVLGILEGSVVDVTALLQLHFGTTAIKKSATDTYSPRTSRWARCLVSPDCKHVSRAKVPACKHPEYPIAVLYLLYMTLKKDLEHISTFHSLPDSEQLKVISAIKSMKENVDKLIKERLANYKRQKDKASGDQAS